MKNSRYFAVLIRKMLAAQSSARCLLCTGGKRASTAGPSLLLVHVATISDWKMSQWISAYTTKNLS